MKKTSKILLLFLIFVMTVITVSCANNNNNDWDNMGGGQTGADVPESEIKPEDIEKPEDVTNVDGEKLETNSEGAIIINLDELVESTEVYIYQDDVLTINKSGTYELSGSLEGAIEIEGDIDDTRIILNNVNVETKDTQNCAAITFLKNSSLRVLTIKEGSINTLKDSVGDNEDGEGAVITAKKSSLTINGTGVLNLVTQGVDATAIKVKKTLDIIGTTINIEATNNGIKADERVYVSDATIKIVAAGDGIKTDIEAESAEEADEFTKDPYAGYIYIKNTSLDVTVSDDGISANSMLQIENNDDNLIKIITNGGTPSVITEYSSDNADGKAIKTDGIVSVIDDVETDLLSQCENNYMLVITGGRFEINSNDDAITSKGNLIISGGTFEISSGDDGIHAEYLTKITNGNININKSYEGIEGASVEILNGSIKVKSTDDGINAANSDLTNWNYNIYIGGGNITVDASGDGIDSNGTVDISGGTTIIYGPTNNGNGSLDSDKGILVKGGVLIAFGPSGMVETPSSNSTQASIVYNSTTRFSAGTLFTVKDSNGNILYEVTPTKVYQSVVISAPELIKGQQFTINCGTTSNTITISGILNKIGQSMGPGGPGGKPGGRW